MDENYKAKDCLKYIEEMDLGILMTGKGTD